MNRNIGLRSRGRLNETSARSALLYGAETWAQRSRLTDILCSCDHGMQRYMAGVRRQDGRSSSDQAVEICGVEDFSLNFRQKRLRWFGNVKRVEGCVE